MRQQDVPKPKTISHLRIRQWIVELGSTMLSHGSQSENRICCQNFHVEANEKIMLATEEANTWEEMEVSVTIININISDHPPVL